MKKKKLRYSELRSLDSAIEQLQGLVDGLRAGALQLERGEHDLQLKPGAVLDFSLSAQREGVQERLELVLEWRRQDLTIGSGSSAESLPRRPRSMTAPVGRGLALQAEAERLFDEDLTEDSADTPLSSDDDYTLAPDDVDQPLPEGPLASASAASSIPPALARDDVDEEAVTVRHSSPSAGQVATLRQGASSDVEWFEQLYTEARAPAGDGRLRLDEQRFAAELARAGLEPQLQRELCSLARQADREGRDRLFEEHRISELIASTLDGSMEPQSGAA